MLLVRHTGFFEALPAECWPRHAIESASFRHMLLLAYAGRIFLTKVVGISSIQEYPRFVSLGLVALEFL